jgi:glutamate dehydrogenase
MRRRTLVELGAPEALAQETALLSPFTTALDVADLARQAKWPIQAAGRLHCVVGSEFGLDALRDAATNMKLEQHWDRLVMRRAAQDFGETQLKLAAAAAGSIGAPPASADNAWAEGVAREWIASLGQPAQRARSAFKELNGQGPWTFAKLMLVAAEFNGLLSSLR